MKKLCLAFPKIHLAAPIHNIPILMSLMEDAHQQHGDLLLFPPLSLTGDGLGELYHYPTLLEAAQRALEHFVHVPIPMLIGLPMKVENKLFSVMAFIQDGEIKGYIPLSSKDRLFSDPLLFPRELLADPHILHLSIYLDDHFSIPGKESAIRAHLLKASSLKTQPLLYLSCPESFSISGGIHASRYSFFSKEKSIEGCWSPELVILELPLEEGETQISSFPALKMEKEFSPLPFLDPSKKSYEELLTHQSRAYAYKLQRSGSKHSLIGISGGLDSTWALIAAIHAHDWLGIPRDHIHPIVMPGFGSSEDTMYSSLQLLRAFDLKPEIISINRAVLQHFEDIGHDPQITDLVYENSQARERTQILMDLANKYHGLVIGTGDMSEIALGWSTYNGDQMSMYGLNAGMPKTLIQDLIDWYAHKENGPIKAALLHILARPISPELLPPDPQGKITQKTEDFLGRYEITDFILHSFLWRTSLFEIDRRLEKAFPSLSKADRKEHLLRFFSRFIQQQFKRTASPHGVRLSEPSLIGFDMASDLSPEDFIKEIQCL